MDEVTLLRALDSNHQDSLDVLQLAFANSHFQVSAAAVMCRACPLCCCA